MGPDDGEARGSRGVQGAVGSEGKLGGEIDGRGGFWCLSGRLFRLHDRRRSQRFSRRRLARWHIDDFM